MTSKHRFFFFFVKPTIKYAEIFRETFLADKKNDGDFRGMLIKNQLRDRFSLLRGGSLMIFIPLAFNIARKFPHPRSRGNTYHFRDAAGAARASRLTPVIPTRLYGVQVFVGGILLISRNLPHADLLAL